MFLLTFLLQIFTQSCFSLKDFIEIVKMHFAPATIYGLIHPCLRISLDTQFPWYFWKLLRNNTWIHKIFEVDVLVHILLMTYDSGLDIGACPIAPGK